MRRSRLVPLGSPPIARLAFGAFTAAFAMLPMGAWLAFTVAAALLAIDGQPLAAAALFGFGAVVMFVGHNFVQPALIGGAMRLPFLWALIGILGGVESFGLVGLFLGPVAMAAFVTVWRDWILRSADAADD